MNIIACVPVELGKRIDPGFPVTAGYSVYEQIDCPRCKSKMWLGIRSKALIESGRATPLCMSCMIKENPSASIARVLTHEDH